MIRQLQFTNSTTDDKRNWDHLVQNTTLRKFTPVLTGFTGTVPTTLRGYAQVFGPLVFIKIQLKSSAAFGWGANSTIDIPVEPYVPTTSSFPQTIDPIINTATNLPVVNEFLQITSGPNGVGRITIRTAQAFGAGPTEAVISGFYIRN